MHDIIQYLSGNIPGGIAIYFAVLAAIFFILFYIYKVSEIFTARHFRRWFIGLWILISVLYLWLWVKNPPESILTRYSIFFYADEPENKWLAEYLNQDMLEHVEPYLDRYNFYFPYHWIYYSDLPLDSRPRETLTLLGRRLPLKKLIVGRVWSERQKLVLKLTYYRFPKQRLEDSLQVEITPARLPAALADLREWIQNKVPLKQSAPEPAPLQKTFVLARSAYLKGDYDGSLRLFDSLVGEAAAHPVIRKWHLYARIKQLLVKEVPGAPVQPLFGMEPPWKKTLDALRSELMVLMKEQFPDYQSDDRFNNLIAETFIVEEAFQDAEVFLKNAYFHNPFNIDVLENLTYLHPSRFADLGFKGELAIQERVLEICPIDLRVLTAYVENVSKISPVDAVKIARAEKRLQFYLELNPASADMWVLLGKFRLHNLKSREALQAFLRADSLTPGDPVVQFNLGVTYFKMDSLEQAERYFQKSVALNNYLDAHLYLGEIYKLQGKYADALKEFRYRVKHKTGDNDFYAFQAMKGIQEVLGLMKSSQKE